MERKRPDVGLVTTQEIEEPEEDDNLTLLREQRKARQIGWPARMKLYDRLRAALVLDKMRLDDELIELPPNTQDAAESCADAVNRKETSAAWLKLVTAQAAMRLRILDKTKSEARITAEAPLELDVIEASQNHEECRAEAAKWQALVSSWDVKRSALRAICELISSGYISSASITEGRREDLTEKRRAMNSR